MTLLTKRTLPALAFGASLVLPSMATSDTVSDEKVILDIWSTYTAARVAGDAETWLSLSDTNGSWRKYRDAFNMNAE